MYYCTWIYKKRQLFFIFLGFTVILTKEKFRCSINHIDVHTSFLLKGFL